MAAVRREVNQWAGEHELDASVEQARVLLVLLQPLQLEWHLAVQDALVGMNVRFIRPLVVSPGIDKSEARLGGMNAPEALSTVCPKPLIPWDAQEPAGPEA
jgi:hypothetical protein